ncbi:DUF6551 family protein [Ruminococcus sp. NK3A76]|uniref:DUF6551 family protein n=1 Tax=Ruminococcus sp. NK3A76 TaxID=877411 RepID=UPI000690F270|nr:DUF6551 family protein [Ruminococcus sp. NK3A76]
METESREVIDDFSAFIPQVNFELIPIKNLVSNQEYQRNLSTKHVKQAAEHFDLYQINPVKVSRRDGINYVFNGQHTIEIVASVSGSRDTPVWCMVYDGLIYEHEADIFANQMKYTKPLSPYEIFMANIEAGNDKQLIIRELVESYNLRIAHNKQVGTICAIATLESIYDKYGLQNLHRVLRLIIGTWEGDVNSFSSSILTGVARLVFTYDTELIDENFKEKLGMYSIREITRSARERANGSLGYAETMLAMYNKKMKYPLDYLRLHSNKGRKRIVPEEFPEEEDFFSSPDERNNQSETEINNTDPLHSNYYDKTQEG